MGRHAHREGGHTPIPQGQTLLYSEPSQASPYISRHPAVHVSVGLSFSITTGQTRIKIWQAAGMSYVQHPAAAIIRATRAPSTGRTSGLGTKLHRAV